MSCTCCNPEACQDCPPCPECAAQRIWTYAYQMDDMTEPELNCFRSLGGAKSYWTYWDAVDSLIADMTQPNTKFGPVQRVTDRCPPSLPACVAKNVETVDV
jgi:hypothetical protein